MSKMKLTVPAVDEWALALRAALSAAGAVSGLSLEMIDDLKTACDEAFYLLTRQPTKADSVSLSFWEENCILKLRITADRAACSQACQAQDPEIAKLIIGTLVGEVHLEKDSCGIHTVDMTLPESCTHKQ